MDFLLTQILNSLVYGMLLFLLAAGLSLIFGLLGVINLAHGSFFMLGGFFAMSVVQLTGSFWLALLLAPLPVVGIAVFIEIFLLKKLYSRSKLDQVLLTFGLSFVLTDLAESVWGKELFALSAPQALNHSIGVLGGMFPAYRLALFVAGLCCALILWLAIERTRLGAMVRASVDNSAVAMGIGLRVPILLTGTFAAGAWLAALAGVVAGPILGVFSGIDVEVLIPAFIVVAIGGLGSLRGSFIGSLIIGFADIFGKAYLPDASMFIIYLAMIVILLVRPHGLFGLDPAGS
jgi:branched-subunit amino acid ABC-type transport system permease component